MDNKEFKKDLIFTMYKDKYITLAFIRSLVNNDYDLARDIFNNIISYQIDIYGRQILDGTYLKNYDNFRKYVPTYKK